jgi:hypothetical protein
MPFALEQLTQALTILGKLDPVSQSAATVTITDLDIKLVRRLMFLIQVGSVGGAGTVDAKLRASKTSGGTYTDVTSSSITQVTTSNKVVTIEVRDDQLENIVGAGYRYVQLSLTVGTNAVLISAIALGAEAEYKPAKANDIAAVAQRLIVPNAS